MALFWEMRIRQRAWADRFNELVPREFNSETLKKLHGEKTQMCFQDHRRLVFFQPHSTAFHGVEWEREKIEPNSARRILRSLYRFGAALPQGFQHDAQREGGNYLDREVFDCDQNGSIVVSGSHANVYANDVVRPSK